MEIDLLLEFGNRKQLREWFVANHTAADHCWVTCNRSKTPRPDAVPYIEVVEEALCFGWIDSTCKRLPDGRLAVITFHSIEDRIVKLAFRKLQNPCTCPPKAPICTCGKTPLGKAIGGAVKASQSELDENPRAHSATLRVFEKKWEDA